MLRAHRAVGAEGLDPGSGRRGWIDTSADAAEARLERADLQEAALDRAMAAPGQEIADGGRRQGRQPPDRALVALPIGRFEAVERLAVDLSIFPKALIELALFV